MSAFTVTVPATTANLGPGFDCLGAALSLYNHFTFSQAPETTITAVGAEAAKVSLDKTNLLYQAFEKFFTHIAAEVPGVAITINTGIPLSRGLGSSATAIVGGLFAANYLAGQPLTAAELLPLAIELEGHPDNVVPAALGNCQLSVSDRGSWQICQVPWQENIIPVVGIPDFELSTAAARAVLPSDYSRAAAIFNVAHLGLLLRALETGQEGWLRTALQDQIHQPYRQGLIRGYTEVERAVLAAGAYGLVISGAGPSLLALCDRSSVDRVRVQMAKAWSLVGVNAQVLALNLDSQGVTIRQVSS